MASEPRQEGRAEANSPIAGRPSRMLARDAADGPVRLGTARHWWNDQYHSALSMPWWGFLLLAAAVYLLTNLLFAGLYLLQPDAISHVGPGDFANAFFFSVQTMATIGYGQLIPQTVYANILVTIEALIGMLMIALTTGLLFARFSRPTARILFSKIAVIGTHEGQPTLFVRLGNERRNQILQATVTMAVLRTEVTREGTMLRRFYDLPLARSHTPVFSMTFLLMHRLDESSPLHGITNEQLAAEEGEIVVTVSGLDETLSQAIHARISYTAEDIRWDHRFADIFGVTADGKRSIDFRRFHDSHPIA
jgi:inward rectifier potassium channel